MDTAFPPAAARDSDVVVAARAGVRIRVGMPARILDWLGRNRLPGRADARGKWRTGVWVDGTDVVVV